MPGTNDTPELDDYQKEKEEFSDAVDDVLGAEEGKTDEEIIAEMDKKQEGKSDVGGEPKKDPKEPIVPDPPAADGSDPDDPESQGIPPATKEIEDPPDTIEAWTKKAGDLEAELAKERQKTSSWNGRITAANNKVKELEGRILELEAQLTVATDNTTKVTSEADNEVLEKLRADFPELSSAFDIMQKRIDGVKPTPAKAAVPAKPEDEASKQAKIDEDAATKKSDFEKAKAEHVASVRKEHSDLPEMVNTGVLLSWINQQPDYIRPTLETIYNKGKAEDVIKMVTNFKKDTGWKSQLKQVGTAEAAAQAKLDAMLEVQGSETRTPDGKVIDKQDFDQGAKDAGL